MSKASPQPTEEEWEARKPIIEELLLFYRLNKEACCHLIQKTGIKINKRQLENRIAWKWRDISQNIRYTEGATASRRQILEQEQPKNWTQSSDKELRNIKRTMKRKRTDFSSNSQVQAVEISTSGQPQEIPIQVAYLNSESPQAPEDILTPRIQEYSLKPQNNSMSQRIYNAMRLYMATEEDLPSGYLEDFTQSTDHDFLMDSGFAKERDYRKVDPIIEESARILSRVAAVSEPATQGYDPYKGWDRESLDGFIRCSLFLTENRPLENQPSSIFWKFRGKGNLYLESADHGSKDGLNKLTSSQGKENEYSQTKSKNSQIKARKRALAIRENPYLLLLEHIIRIEPMATRKLANILFQRTIHGHEESKTIDLGGFICSLQPKEAEDLKLQVLKKGKSWCLESLREGDLIHKNLNLERALDEIITAPKTLLPEAVHKILKLINTKDGLNLASLDKYSDSAQIYKGWDLGTKLFLLTSYLLPDPHTGTHPGRYGRQKVPARSYQVSIKNSTLILLDTF